MICSLYVFSCQTSPNMVDGQTNGAAAHAAGSPHSRPEGLCPGTTTVLCVMCYCACWKQLYDDPQT